MIGRIRQLSHVQTFSVLAVVVLLALVGVTVTISQRQQIARNQASTTGSGISMDTTSLAHSDNVSSLSWTQTVNAHLNQILIVTVSTYEHITESVTYNGVAMTKVGNATCLSTCNASMWYLINPPTGSHTIYAKLSGSTSVVGGAATYFNVDQSNPFGSVATKNGKSTTSSVTVSSSQSQLIVDSYTNENHGGTPASGQTQVYEDNTINAGGSSYKDGAAGSTTMTWNEKSSTSENWALLGVPMNGISSGSNTSVPVVNSLVLINAQTKTQITTLSNNAVVDLSTVGTNCLNIRAMTTPSIVGSVVFAYDGNTHYRTENNAPYDLGGDVDTGDTPNCMSLGVGDHVLAATPYTSSNGSGDLGLPALISFTVVSSNNQTNTPTPGSCGLVVSTPLSLDKTTVTYNGTINGTVTYKNTCSNSISVNDIIIASRTSTGSNVDFSGDGGSMTIQPGQTVTVSGSNTIASGAPLGQWYAFASYKDTQGNWHEDQNNVSYTVVSSISATGTPAPTSPAATQSPVPTLTPAAGDTILGLNVLLHGLGKAGDNANPNGTGNTSPIHPQRTIVVQVYDSNNNLVVTNQGPVTYDSGSGSFKGTIDLGANISTGAYTVKLKTDQYLRALVSGIQTLTAGQINQLPQTSLVVGDINNDNQINILDYNILMGCYSDLLPPVSCATGNNVLSDLDDDGHVNQFDYNLFLRELSNSAGQ